MDTPPTVTLRALIPADAETLAAWATDETFIAHADWTPGLPLVEHERFWRTLITDPPDPALLRLAAVHDDALVGYVDLHGLGPTERELGYVIGPSERWGHGWGTAAARAGLEHAFDHLGMHAVWAEAVEQNVPSVRILERLGMQMTGHGEETRFLGATARYAQYRISRETYQLTSNARRRG